MQIDENQGLEVVRQMVSDVFQARRLLKDHLTGDQAARLNTHMEATRLASL